MYMLLQTKEQYQATYEALVCALSIGNTEISMESLLAGKPDKSTLEEQFKILAQFTVPLDIKECPRASAHLNKSRNSDVLVRDCDRPMLKLIDGRSNFINACYLSGYLVKDKYVVTEWPLPDTVIDFWRMIFEFKYDVIVMLNEFEVDKQPDFPLFYPQNLNATENFDLLSVSQFGNTVTENGFTVLDLRITQDGDTVRTKMVFSNQWPNDSALPTKNTTLLSVFSEVGKAAKRFGAPILVVCRDGFTRSGLFCCGASAIEKLVADETVDVFNCVKAIRENRPQLIPNVEQYEYLHKMVRAYNRGESREQNQNYTTTL